MAVDKLRSATFERSINYSPGQNGVTMMYGPFCRRLIIVDANKCMLKAAQIC